MKEDLHVQEDIIIPAHELEITASRSSGPGGQNVNKVSTRITLRWNVRTTQALSDAQKELVIKNIPQHFLTEHGDILIHQSESRSQIRNKEQALKELAVLIQDALHIPKERIPSKVPRSIKEARILKKKERSSVKRLRQKKFEE